MIQKKYYDFFRDFITHGSYAFLLDLDTRLHRTVDTQIPLPLQRTVICPSVAKTLFIWYSIEEILQHHKCCKNLSCNREDVAEKKVVREEWCCPLPPTSAGAPARIAPPARSPILLSDEVRVRQTPSTTVATAPNLRLQRRATAPAQSKLEPPRLCFRCLGMKGEDIVVVKDLRDIQILQ